MNFALHKTIEFQNVEFTITARDGGGSEYKLVSISNTGPVKDILIPHKFPSGEKITLIGPCFCEGEYRKITIDDRISVIQEGAFFEAIVEEIVWPASCRLIPVGCFSCSTVSKISNIDNVCTVEERGFSQLYDIDIKWPSCCDSIPYGCFYGSAMNSVTNLDNIVFIDQVAFSSATLDVPLDLSRTFSVEFARRALDDLKPEQVIPPYYIPASVLNKAF